MQAFVFSDLEASTRLWEEHPEEMGPALERHFEILSQAVGEGRGTIVKNTGDGLIAVFDSPSDAVAMALGAQRALGGEEWGASAPLRARIGIHAGVVEQRDGDFFGQTMNRSARIMAAGHGGQVLVSGSAAAETTGLPDGASLRDLGSHRLKDLTQPEHLYQLVHPDLRADFPALLTLDANPNNLPLQATEFLGRAHELSTIRALLDSPATRLLTLAGPGGAGKTRLGLQVAAELADRFRDGVYFVDLAPEQDSSAAFEAVVRALDLPAAGGSDPLEVLASRLRDRQMLLLLDNFEQVTEAAPGVAELITRCPGLKVLVTSREILHVRAEQVYPVPPLSMPDPRSTRAEIAESEAVQLFVDRARAVRPEFALGDESASVVAEICLRLDGLPLAIELAAARLNVFTPADLLERLRKRLDVLGAGGRDLPARQRTLWGAIAWSYELLDPDESRVFEMMSVFSPTRLEAIEAVAMEAMPDVEVIDAISSLVDKSLIRSDGSGQSSRFSMLLTIKEFAEERLGHTPELNTSVRFAHAAYFSNFAWRLNEELRGAGRQQALEDLAGDIGNLRSAWRLWVEEADLQQLFALLDGLWALHDARGWYHAAIELANDALTVLATADPTPELAAEELTLRTSMARALMAVRGYTVEVEAAFKEILAMSREMGGAARQYPVLRALATFYMNIADWASARDIGLQLLEMAEAEDDDSILVEGHYLVGASTSFMGDLEHGMQHLDRAIELIDPTQLSANRFRLGPHTAVVARVASGLLLYQCGAAERSIARVTGALDIAEKLDHPYSLAYAIYHNGFLAMMRGRFEECRELAGRLGVVSAENDYAVWLTLSTVLEGISLTALGEHEEGLTLTEKGIELYQGLTTPPVFWPLILNLRGMVHGLAGDPERGLELIEEAIDLQGEAQVTPDFLITRGDVSLMRLQPDPGPAQASYLAALDLARGSGLRLFEVQALTRLVELNRRMGAGGDRTSELAALYETFTEGHAEHDLLRARAILDENAPL